MYQTPLMYLLMYGPANVLGPPYVPANVLGPPRVPANVLGPPHVPALLGAYNVPRGF